jgi:hypothetical protein
MVFSHAAPAYSLSLEHEAEVHVDGEAIEPTRKLEMRCHSQMLRVRGVELDGGEETEE